VPEQSGGRNTMKADLVRFSGAARLDMLRIWNYYAEAASLDVADAMISDLERAMVELTENSGLGHRREDITQREVRFFLVHRYFVIYRPDTRPLRIVRVLHASQNLTKLLKT
jgi:plasmid stabilization system protein ParE